MLQTLNIPSSPLPEVPSAQSMTPGDAGERAEFAQLLQQAKGIDADAAPDTPTVTSAKDARPDTRMRPGATRGPKDVKPHEMQRTPTAADDTADADALDLTVCVKAEPLADAPVTAAETIASDAHAPQPDDAATPVPLPDGAVLPARWQALDTQPAAPAQALAATAGDEQQTLGARFNARIGAREARPSAHIDAGTPAAGDANATRTAPAADPSLPAARETAFDLALRDASSGRRTNAPLFDRTPLESTPAAAQAAFARELHQPQSARAETLAEATLRSAPDEAGFAPALGTQVALWVKDGVQEARLQLHPAELGPVTVQIALEGQAAHIDFTAAVAATRESIEQSLPALAAALRESGFTLAGGGVFGRSGQGANDSGRERAPQGRGTRGAAAIASGGTGEAVALPLRRWSRSLVDVYA